MKSSSVSRVLLFVLLSISALSGALMAHAGFFKEFSDSVSEAGGKLSKAVKNSTKSAQEIAQDFSNAAVDERRAVLQAAEDQQFTDIVREAINIDVSKLGEALENVSVEKVSDALKAAGDDLGRLAAEISDNNKLGDALDNLDVTQIRGAFEAVPNRIGDLAPRLQSARLGQVLNGLPVAQITDALASVPSRIGDVARHIGSADLGKALNGLGVEEIGDALTAVEGRIAQVAKEVNSEKLGKALNSVRRASQVSAALGGALDRIGDVAKHIVSNQKLGAALNSLSADAIGNALAGVRNRIGQLAPRIDAGKLGQALTNLGPDAIRDALAAVPGNIADVVVALKNNVDLGKALNNLDQGLIAKALAALPIERLKEITAQISSANLGRALSQLTSAPATFIEVLKSVSVNQAGDVLEALGEDFNSLLNGLADRAELGHVLAGLNRGQLAKLPWEELTKIKMPWEQLKPRLADLPLDRIDPSQINWGKASPAQAFEDAGRWLDGQLKAAENQVGTTIAAAGKEFVAAISSGAGIVNELSRQFADAKERVVNELAKSGEFINSNLAKMEQGVRTEIGRGVAEVKKAPWYQEIQKFLTKFSRVVAYDLASETALSFNFRTGAYDAQLEFIPGVTVTSQDFEALLSSGSALPDVDVMEVASTAAAGVKLAEKSNNYDERRRRAFEGHSRTDVYYSSRRFAKWASTETLLNHGVKAVITAGYGVNDALQDAQHHFMTELDDVYSWLQSRAKLEGERLSRTVLRDVLKCLITGKSPSELGLSIPRLSIRTDSVAYVYEVEAAGVTEVIGRVLDEVQAAVGINWGKFEDALNEKLSKLGMNSPHIAFVITWDSDVEDGPALDAAMNEFDEVQLSDVDSAQERYDLLLEALQELVDAPPAGVNLGPIKQLLGFMKQSANVQGVVNARVQKALAEAIGFDPAAVELRYDQSVPIIDLTNTPVREKLEGFLDRFALGNEGSASVTRLELNVSNYALSCDASIRHKHVWNLEQGLSNAWEKATAGVQGWTTKASQTLSAGTSKVLRDVGAIDEVARRQPHRITQAALGELAMKVDEADQAVVESARADDQARENLERSPDGLASAREYLLWHLLEKPQYVEISSGKTGGPYGGDPVYFVNGLCVTLADARDSGTALADRFQRPVRLLYNPSFINADAKSGDIGVELASTGTPDVGSDLGEACYDRSWPSLMTAYFDAMRPESLEALLETKPEESRVRLQKNLTTRQIAHLIYFNEKPITIVAHSQGAIQVRNACYTMTLLGAEGKVRNNVALVSCGSPLAEGEIFPKPAQNHVLVNAGDVRAKLVNLTNGDEAGKIPLSGDGMEFYFDNISASDLYPTQARIVANNLEKTHLATAVVRLKQTGADSEESLSSAEMLVYSDQSTSVIVDATRIDVARKPPSLVTTTYALNEDFNNDDYDDLCFVREVRCGPTITRRLQLVFNRGLGVSRQPDVQLDDPFDGQPGRLIAGDFDGDGFGDVLLMRRPEIVDSATRTAGRILCASGNARLGFDRVHSDADEPGQHDLLWYYGNIQSGDFNGDGLTDLMAIDKRTSGVYLQLRRPDGGFRPYVGPIKLDGIAKYPAASPLIGDFNGDGRDDLILAARRMVVTHVWCDGVKCRRYSCQCLATNEVYLSAALGDGFVKQPRPDSRLMSTRVNLAGDLNGDGFDDLLDVSHISQNAKSDRYSFWWIKNCTRSSTLSGGIDLRPSTVGKTGVTLAWGA
jgi:hypothetical protein